MQPLAAVFMYAAAGLMFTAALLGLLSDDLPVAPYEMAQFVMLSAIWFAAFKEN